MIYFEMKLDSVINRVISGFTCDGRNLDFVIFATPFQFLSYVHLF